MEDISSLNYQIKEYDNQIEILSNAQKEMNESNKLEKENFYKITAQLIDSKRKLLEEMEDLEKHRKLFFDEVKFNKNESINIDNSFNANYGNSPGNNPIKSNSYFNSMQINVDNDKNFLNIKGVKPKKKNLNNSMQMLNDDKITLRVDNLEDFNRKRQTPPKLIFNKLNSSGNSQVIRSSSGRK